MDHFPQKNDNSILYYRKDQPGSKPVIPVEMSAHIFKRMRETKEKKPITFYPPNPDDLILTGPPVIPFDEPKDSNVFDFEEVLKQKPFMRKVVYLTNETLPEAFALLNRVSASRMLFDASIKVSIHEDTEKSLWYLEVIT